MQYSKHTGSVADIFCKLQSSLTQSVNNIGTMSAQVLLLDGGLASQLVADGFADLDSDPLWSARLLSTNQSAVRDAQQAFISAGADIIETNTYQVSLEGFEEFLSLSSEDTLQLIKQSVTEIARPLVDQWEKSTGKRVLIAGSIGPYGAALHDGSEYSGCYVDTVSTEQLIEWHKPRMRALADSGVDLFAFETIPAQKEGEALVRLLTEEFSGMKAWLSYSCKDGLHTNHGELLTNAVKAGVDCSQVTHVGVNCTSPEHISSLLDSLQVYRDKTPFIVYPNSGESWTSGTGWDGDSKLSNIETFTLMCKEKGATIIGGCCRVTGDKLKTMRKTLDR